MLSLPASHREKTALRLPLSFAKVSKFGSQASRFYFRLISRDKVLSYRNLGIDGSEPCQYFT